MNSVVFFTTENQQEHDIQGTTINSVSDGAGAES